MNLDIIKYYYDQLKPDSIEANVDRIWTTILPMYFEARMNYGIESQQRPWPGVSQMHAEFIIRFIRNGYPKKVVIIEDKRVSEESSSSTWKSAVDQITNYMKLARGEQFTSLAAVEPMYAIVTVGHYSRFYILKPTGAELEDYDGTDGRYFEFKDDEEMIDQLLLDIVSRTSH